VFVTDSVEGIVPEYLTLLHGVLDSPDIPLNVSRSYLQADGNVKKISNHITKKVADRLNEIFRNERTQFEEKWDALKIFIVFGMLTDEKFYEKAKDFALFKNVDGKFFTFEEYKNLITSEQTDKDGNLICLYANDADEQHSYIEAAQAKGYDVLLMDGQLDSHWVGQWEQKNEKVRFVRVDSDVVGKLIQKSDAPQVELNDDQRQALTSVFQAQLPKIEKSEFIVTLDALGEDAAPIIITQNEFMRRMKDMSRTGGNPMMAFYGEIPDSYSLVLNTTHPLMKAVLDAEEAECAAEIKPIVEEMKSLDARKAELKKSHEGKKDDEVPVAEKEEINNLDRQIAELGERRTAVFARFAAGHDKVKQLIDLALLANNMLKGKDLADFVKRSISMMK
jgi:molecular chaperone HtpG